MNPSSLTKVMTTYLLLEALHRKDFQASDEVPVSVYAAKQEGSRMFLKPEQNVSMEDLLKGIVTVSGNDACSAFAEFFAGSEEAFAQMMNEKAKELGATDTHFINASGLPSPQHWSTCWDLAKIAQKTIEHFPKEYELYYSMKQFTFNGIKQFNRNALLRNGFADGMKTGYTHAGKYGIIASARRGGRRLLLVLNGVETESVRNQEAKRLLSWGFQFFQPVVLYQKGETVREIPVWKHEPMPMVALEKIALSLPKNLLHKTEVKISYLSPLQAPIQEGVAIGTLWITIAKQEPLRFPLGAGRTMKKRGFFYWIKSLFQLPVSEVSG